MKMRGRMRYRSGKRVRGSEVDLVVLVVAVAKH